MSACPFGAFLILLFGLNLLVLDVLRLLPHPHLLLAAQSEDLDVHAGESCSGSKSFCQASIDEQLAHLSNAPKSSLSSLKQGLSSPTVRNLYEEQISDFNQRAQDAYDQAHTQLVCGLAKTSVINRNRLKTEMRLKGSAILHTFLLVRDRLTYGSVSGMSPQQVFKKVRKALVAKGENPSDMDVCEEVRRSSMRSNASVTKASRKMKSFDLGYAPETATIHLLTWAVLAGVIYSTEMLCCKKHPY